MIGVLGGMGPAATVDFMVKLIRLTPGGRDRTICPWSWSPTPGCPIGSGQFLEGRGEPPLAAMREGVRRLERAGAECVAIPCHTAHYWYQELASGTALPILHIVDAALAELERLEVPPGRWASWPPRRPLRPASIRRASPRPAIRRSSLRPTSWPNACCRRSCWSSATGPLRRRRCCSARSSI